MFEEAGKVIQSPRCMNCHPAGERPTQTDRMTPHQPLVVRGDGGMGAPGGLVCSTCHHETNFDPAGVPGNPKWSLAPVEMAWQGKTLGEICVQIKDKGRNGGKGHGGAGQAHGRRRSGRLGAGTGSGAHARAGDAKNSSER